MQRAPRPSSHPHPTKHGYGCSLGGCACSRGGSRGEAGMGVSTLGAPPWGGRRKWPVPRGESPGVRAAGTASSNVRKGWAGRRWVRGRGAQRRGPGAIAGRPPPVLAGARAGPPAPRLSRRAGRLSSTRPGAEGARGGGVGDVGRGGASCARRGGGRGRVRFGARPRPPGRAATVGPGLAGVHGGARGRVGGRERVLFFLGR